RHAETDLDGLRRDRPVERCKQAQHGRRNPQNGDLAKSIPGELDVFLPFYFLVFPGAPTSAPGILSGADRSMELLNGRTGEVIDVIAQSFHRHPDHHVQQLRSGIALIEKRLNVGIGEPPALVDDLAYKAT